MHSKALYSLPFVVVCTAQNSASRVHRSGGALFDKFDADLIGATQDALTVDNLMMSVVAKDMEAETDRWVRQSVSHQRRATRSVSVVCVANVDYLGRHGPNRPALPSAAPRSGTRQNTSASGSLTSCGPC